MPEPRTKHVHVCLPQTVYQALKRSARTDISVEVRELIIAHLRAKGALTDEELKRVVA